MTILGGSQKAPQKVTLDVFAVVMGDLPKELKIDVSWPLRCEIKEAFGGGSKLRFFYFGSFYKRICLRKDPKSKKCRFWGVPESIPKSDFGRLCHSKKNTFLVTFLSFLSIAERQKDYRIRRFHWILSIFRIFRNQLLDVNFDLFLSLSRAPKAQKYHKTWRFMNISKTNKICSKAPFLVHFRSFWGALLDQMEVPSRRSFSRNFRFGSFSV